MKRSGANERPLYGRDALFQAERLGKDFWRRHKDRSELLVYKERIADNQKRAEYVNEVRRIEGFLQHNLTYQARRDYLEPRKKELLMKLGTNAVPE